IPLYRYIGTFHFISWIIRSKLTPLRAENSSTVIPADADPPANRLFILKGAYSGANCPPSDFHFRERFRSKLTPLQELIFRFGAIPKNKNMAGKPKPMSQVKQILRMHYKGTGIKTIARNLQISKNTVKDYLR